MAGDIVDVLVVGAGAAGLTAAIRAAEVCRSLRVTLIERAAKIGAKILISGGGRCNVTNAVVGPDDFHGKRTVVRNVLAAFDATATRDWFESLGVRLKEEEHGKLFPVGDRAATVVDALVARCEELGVERVLGVRVDDLSGPEPFVVRGEPAEWRARSVILATGGRSLARTGSDGLGWEIARRLGHSVTPTFPALVPLVLHADFFHATLSGLSHGVELSVFVDGKIAERRRGSLLFTHFGVSGPAVLDASHAWLAAVEQQRRVALHVNFMAGQSFDAVERYLVARSTVRPRLTLLRLLGETMPERLAAELLRRAGVAASTPLATLTRTDRRAVAHVLTDLPLPVLGARGWDFAEVTAGGVPLAEVSYRTMESRRCPGLYLAGEILDCDGRLGGFNFQWAWSTGYLAGRASGLAAAAPRSPC